MLQRVEEHVHRMPERLQNGLKEAVHQLQEKVGSMRGVHPADASMSRESQPENPQRQTRPESQTQGGRDSIYNYGYESPDRDQQSPGSSRDAGNSGQPGQGSVDRER